MNGTKFIQNIKMSFSLQELSLFGLTVSTCGFKVLNSNSLCQWMLSTYVCMDHQTVGIYSTKLKITNDRSSGLFSTT